MHQRRSSPTRVIDAALRRLELDRVLTLRASAEEVPLGKPHPAVYLLAAERGGWQTPTASPSKTR